MNKDKLILVLVTVLVFSSGFFLFKVYSLKSQVSALTLRTKIAAKEKRKATTWEASKKIPSRIAVRKKITPTATSSTTETIVHDFSAIETEKLMTNLEKGMKTYWRLNLDNINEDLAITEELISRNPDVYSSHKAKLILMLAKENHLKADVDEADIEQTLSTLADFDTVTDKVLQKEAFLIARTNKRIETLIDEVDQMEEQLEGAETVEEEAALEQKIAEKLLEMEGLENQLEEGLLADKDFLNEDVVEIPMYRALARGEYDEVIDQAQSLLEAYPDSISGHYFTIRALQLSGDNTELREYLSNLRLSDEDIKELEDRVNNTSEEDPREFWKRLRF